MSERSIFMAALEHDIPTERSAYLDEACSGDAALRQRVEALLASHEQGGSFLARPVPERLAEKPVPAGPPEETCGQAPAAAVPPRPFPEGLGSRIGPYKLLQEIGEGGMGIVHLAEQSEPVRRMVALKIIKPGIDSRQVIARFEAERQALAVMDHPNIARVLDGGTTDSGRPYFVMELIKGVPITKFCDERRMTPRQRLELFVPVCQAVQHAHQKGIIHRDLKPSNVLVCLYDGKPVPKVIDFGVAKATGQKLTERTMFTEIGQVVGTLEYMSPEQAELNQLDIDTRSDVYSLGVLLYELLTGSTPLERKRLKSAAMLEVLRLIREEEPPKPSTRLSTIDEMPSVAANRGLEPKKLSGLIRGELDWIVMKALEKDRNRRYETASGFAMDVQRYLADEPVLACPPSASYRFRKFVRRRRGPVLAATVILLLLVGGIVGTSLGLLQARTSEQRAEKAAIKAGEERDAANEARTAEKVQRQRAEDLGKELRRKLYVAETNRAGEASATPLGLGRVAELLSPWREGQPDLRGWEWYYLYGQCHQDLWTTPVASEPGLSLAWSPDGTRLATAQGPFGRPMVWDAASGKEAVVLEWGDIRDLGPGFIDWSPDGTQLAYAFHTPTRHSRMASGIVAVWDAATGKRRFTIEPAKFNLRSVVWGPDSRRLAVADVKGDILILDAKTGKPTLILRGHNTWIRSMAWNHGGTRLASADLLGKLKIWDVAAGKVVLDIAPQARSHISWSPDDSRLVSGSEGGVLQIWDTTTGKQLVICGTYPRCQLVSAAWSPDGKLLAFGTDMGEVRLTDAATGTVLSIQRGHSDFVRCVAWSPDGARLASGSDDRTFKVWDANQPDPLLHRATRTELKTTNPPWVHGVSWSPNGKRLASAGGGTVKVWNAATRAGASARSDTVTLTEHARTPQTKVAWQPDGTRLASTDATAIQIWDAASGKELLSLKGDGARAPLVCSLAWSPDGKRLASAGWYGTVTLWDPVTREQTRRLELDKPSADIVTSVSWSPDGTRLAAACNSGVVVIWDTTTGQSTCTLKGHADELNSVAWCPTGTRLASAGRDRVIQVWDAATGKLLCTLKGHTGWVNEVSWAPDGKRLASCSNDQTVKLWDPITGEVVVTFPFPQSHPIPLCLAWRRDGLSLAVGCVSEVIEIFDATKGYRLAGRQQQ